MTIPPSVKRLLTGPIGLCLAVFVALTTWRSAAAPTYAPSARPHARATASAAPAPATRTAAPAVIPSDRPTYVADDPSPALSRRGGPTVAARSVTARDELLELKRPVRGVITAEGALAELRVLQHDRTEMPAAAGVTETMAAAAPAQPTGSETPSARTEPVRPPEAARQAKAVPNPVPLRPLQVGARLPGMPEYVVVGRTYTDACITPARNIPTQRVPFVDYLRNVLANEWVAAWPSAALDAGAIAVKQYAWYTVVVERKWRDQGYPFDLIDNTCDQYYRDASADPRTDAAIQRTWTTVVTRDSRLLRMFYRDRDATCAGRRDCMGQVETAVLAGAGHSHLEILARYFGTPGTVVSTTGEGLPERLPPVPAAPARPRATAQPTKPAPPRAAAPPPPPVATAPARRRPPVPTESRRRSPVPTESIEQPPSEPETIEDVTPETRIAAPTPAPSPTPEPPPPTATPEPPTPTPVPPMPDLVGLGEKQAKAALAKLGIYMVIVDYQGRDKLGERFDQLPAYTVVSHNPPAGAPAKAGMMVKLGVRGP